MSTQKKSVATMAWAWELMNSLQVGPVRLGTGSRPALRRICQTVAADAVPDPAHLAVGTSISPCGVLGFEAQYKLSELGRGWWPSGSGTWWVGPVAGHQAPVPADHGGRFDDQHHPDQASPVKGPGQQGENGSVGGSKAPPINL